jgi:hypothetical protein
MDNKEEVKTVMIEMFETMREHGKSPDTGPRPNVQPDENNDLGKTIDLMKGQVLSDVDTLGTKNGRKE